MIATSAIRMGGAQPSTSAPTDFTPQRRPDRALETFKVATDGDYLVIPVRIASREYFFALDTGSTCSAIDTSLRSLVGDRLFPCSRAGVSPDEIELFRGPRLSIGKLKAIEDPPVGVLDLAFFREISGQDLRGLLGMDFLREHIVEIDSDNGTLSFLASLPANPGFELRLSFSSNRPYLEAKLGGATDRFLIDTGWVGGSSGMITTQQTNSLLRSRLAELSGRFSAQSAWGETFQGRVISVNSFGIGPFEHKELSFAEAKENLITTQYLKRYIVTFDFPHGKVYLKKGASYSDPERKDLSGLTLVRQGAKTVVRDVYRSSPAAKAGIQVNDVILKIGDKNAKKSRIMELRSLFCDEGRTIPIKLEHGGKELDVSIFLLWSQEDAEALNLAPGKGKSNAEVELDTQGQMAAPLGRRGAIRPFRR
jgi:hypothetical protein